MPTPEKLPPENPTKTLLAFSAMKVPKTSEAFALTVLMPAQMMVELELEPQELLLVEQCDEINLYLYFS